MSAEFELQQFLESCLEVYEHREDAGLNTGAHYLTWYEFLRIQLWDAGYRKTDLPISAQTPEKESN